MLGKECLTERVSENIKETSASNNRIKRKYPKEPGAPGHQLLQVSNIQPSGTVMGALFLTMDANGILD